MRSDGDEPHHYCEGKNEKAGDGIRTHDVLLGKQALYRWVTPAIKYIISNQREVSVKDGN